MVRGQGSVAAPLVPTQRRSSRVNLGLNGRAVQLDRLGGQLVAPVRQKKRQFIPEDGVVLENNALAPVPKKRRSKGSRSTQPQSQPPVIQPPPQPRQPPVDNRYGFHPPLPTQRTVIPSAPAQPRSSYLPPHPSHVSPPLQHSQLPPRSSSPNAPESSSDSEANQEVDGGDMELEIDEQSDDEDTRQAHALLRASPDQAVDIVVSQPPVLTTQGAIATTASHTGHQGHLGFADLGAEESVLQNHYNHNRPPRAPRFQPIDTAPRSRQPLPPADTDSKPRTLESYPPQWQEVIMYAKRAFRTYIAGHCGFPDGVVGIAEAKECLEDAVAAHLDDGGNLEPGHQINRDMLMIVFGESWQLRSQLKADIRVQVRNLKSLFPDSGTHLRPPHEVQMSIRERVSMWISDGSYLHDTIPGSDEQVHFGHPIIASICKSFYFDRWSDISAFDRDTFRGSVPKPLVALVGTIYRNALDEWSNGTPSTVKLESKHYTKVYNAILDSIETVDRHDHYGPLLRQRFTAWAGFGESISSSSRVPVSIPVNIHLNLCPPTG